MLSETFRFSFETVRCYGLQSSFFYNHNGFTFFQKHKKQTVNGFSVVIPQGDMKVEMVIMKGRLKLGMGREVITEGEEGISNIKDNLFT